MFRHKETESQSISVRRSFESGTKHCPIQTRLDKFDNIRQLDEVLWKTGYASILSAALDNTEYLHFSRTPPKRGLHTSPFYVINSAL